jgi:uncharacterized protein (UPF0261 family)
MSVAIEMPRILVLGTGDTKSAELGYIAERITAAGGQPVMVDISILSEPPYRPDYSRHDLAAAINLTIDDIINSGDEHSAMALMSAGAVAMVRRLHAAGSVDGLLVLGGSMGTDLALDVACALPIGIPKFVVSTIAFSHLLPPERIAPDLMMILWSGGLYGLNDICRSILSQAAGAVVGAARVGVRPKADRPLIGITSLGSTCLKYMKLLKPALEARGYDVAVFHSTGMGGRAFEAIAAHAGFAAVFDFCIQEVVNHQNGTVVTSGPDRLENAGLAGIPQIVAPGAVDMVDLPAWQSMPAALADRPYHAHNRLIGSITTSPEGRRATAMLIGEKLAKAKAPVAFLLPVQGVQEWDQPGEPLHDPEGLAAFTEAMRLAVPATASLHEVDAHINSPQFAAASLAVFDQWVRQGIIPEGKA